MKFTKLSETAFKELQLNAGIILTDFNPTSAAVELGNILGATSGGVNFTAGLRVVRTSPDHGTAYGIAGKNEADATSMMHAIYTAIDVLKTRKENTELLANQLIVERKEVKKEYKVEKFIPQD